MENQEQNNNLKDQDLENTADRSNMPDQQVPRHRSNDRGPESTVKTDAGYLNKDPGYGDYGSEEARSDAYKGNKGHAGNMPNTTEE